MGKTAAGTIKLRLDVSELDLDRLEALAKAATPGPWRAYETMAAAEMFVVDPRGFLHDGIVCGPTYEKRNVEFIAAANPEVVAALVAEVRRLQREVQHLTVSERKCASVSMRAQADLREERLRYREAGLMAENRALFELLKAEAETPSGLRALLAEVRKERDDLAGKVERVEAVAKQVEADEGIALDVTGQHLHGTVVTVAEMIRAALAGTDEVTAAYAFRQRWLVGAEPGTAGPETAPGPSSSVIAGADTPEPQAGAERAETAVRPNAAVRHGFTPSRSPFADPDRCVVMLARYPCPYSRDEHPDLPPADTDTFGYLRVHEKRDV